MVMDFIVKEQSIGIASKMAVSFILWYPCLSTYCHVSNYSSYLRQFYHRLNPASPLYRLSQRAVFYGTFLSALLTIPILSHIVFS